MGKTDMQKTNAMRLLDAAGIAYSCIEYDADDDEPTGLESLRTAAGRNGLSLEQVFKTLVLQGAENYAVCCIPIVAELDLKKAAQATAEKKIDLIPVKNLLAVTGYVRGGCSPIGMKKQFPAYFDEIARAYDRITVSAGVRGQVLALEPQQLLEYLAAETGDLVK
jgi:Cys-tRNA(Pro)/Cys-tRNA(Cys) deacylase